MHRLNSALEELRRRIPSYMQYPPRKLSKIKTLKLAIDYIRILEDLLHDSYHDNKKNK